MKNNIIKTILITIILLWIWNYNQVNAESTITFDNIYNEIEEVEVNCQEIKKEVYQKYPVIFDKISKIFNKLDWKGYSSKPKFLKFKRITSDYLKRINKDIQYKKYIIISHIKCESEKKIDNLTEENKKCFWDEKEWSDYNEYSSLGYHVYHNTVWHASYSSKCTSYWTFTATKFMYCDDWYEKLPYLVKIDDDGKKPACWKIQY